MTDQNELKYYIEDLGTEEVEALVSVRISKFSGETITGHTPSHVVTYTCSPADGWSDEDRQIIEQATHSIASVLRERYETGVQELLMCPFCGGTPTLQVIEPHTHGLATFMPDHPGSAIIECGCEVGMIDETPEKVISKWNRRVI
jgi:hypothetical protein